MSSSSMKKPAEFSVLHCDNLLWYYITKSNRLYTDHPNLVELQELNDVNLGRVLHSNVICSDIIDHISSEMRRAVIKGMIAAMHLVQFYCTVLYCTVLYCKLWTQGGAVAVVERRTCDLVVADSRPGLDAAA